MHDPSRDFDFWIGRWNVHHARLKSRLTGSSEWEEFDGTAEARLLPGNLGNIDECHLEAWRPGLVGMTVRLFNRSTQQWSIHWADSAHGVFDPPVVGGFRDDGIGIFEGDDQHEGIAVRVRFIWTHPTASTVRWEQAFSADGGVTWETNWIMKMTRA